MTPIRSFALAATAVIAFGGACAGGSEAGPSAVPDARAATEVAVVNIAYAPETITVETGTEVVWTNEDQSVHHTVTSGIRAKDGVPGVSKGKLERADGTFDGDLPDASSEFRFTFDEAGTYAYFCRVHPSMTGAVVVQ